MSRRAGRHFLQIPGPSNIPDRVLRAMDRPIIDHRGPEFAKLAGDLLTSLRPIFGTGNPVMVFPSSGTGFDVPNTGFSSASSSLASLPNSGPR